MKITPKQIEVISLRDLFPDSEDARENLLSTLQIEDEDGNEIRNRQMWSMEELTYLIDYEINSRLYDIQDPSFVYHADLWISARQVANHWPGDSESRKRFNAEERLHETEEYNSLLKAKEFLSAHPKCYVFNGTEENTNPWSIKKMTVVSYELLVDDKRDWYGVWDDHVDDEYTLLLNPDDAVNAIEDYIEEFGDADQLKKVVKRIKKNPGVNVIVHDYYVTPRLRMSDLAEGIHHSTTPASEESLKNRDWKHRAEIKETDRSWDLYSDASFQQWYKRSSDGKVEYCDLKWDMNHYKDKYRLYELRNWKFVSVDNPARQIKIETLPTTFHYV